MVVFVVDSGVFMNTSVLNLTENLLIPSVAYDEIQSRIAQFHSANSQISVQDPKSKSITKIQSLAKTVGQKGLSKQDIAILALAYEILQEGEEVCLISDDFAVKNVANFAKIPVKGYLLKRGEESRKYFYVCNACQEVYNMVVDECDVCGHKQFKRYYKVAK